MDQNLNMEEHILQLENDARVEFENDFMGLIINDQEIGGTSLNFSDPPHLQNPSHSSNLLNPFNISKSPYSSNSSTSFTRNTIRMNDEPKTKYLFNFHNKIYIHNLSSSEDTSEENIIIPPLVESIIDNDLSIDMSSESDNSDADSETENSNDFVEDLDIVDPDILYNILLNEHFKQLQLLVQKISETPLDKTVISESMLFPSIPEKTHKPKTFTLNEIKNFTKGISEYEYDINSEDWNKIMVKRAVIFTAHAGFTIANEESLYVLADVAIDFIKKLAVIMKSNFDIQENNPNSDSIDPINASLIQIGAKGGLAELISHHKNDIFGRHDELIEKCQQLHQIIDKFIEEKFGVKSKTQSFTKDYFVQENPADGSCITNEINLNENEVNVESINRDNMESEKLQIVHYA